MNAQLEGVQNTERYGIVLQCQVAIIFPHNLLIDYRGTGTLTRLTVGLEAFLSHIELNAPNAAKGSGSSPGEKGA